MPESFKEVGIEEKLGETLPLETILKKSNGESVTLGTLLQQGKPTLMIPVYYECPMLCSLILNGALEGLKGLDWTVGDEFNVITFSFDHTETPELALANKTAYTEQYGRKISDESWYFLTGDSVAVHTLASALGFSFKWDEATQQFAHGAALMTVTPQGVISRYLYGIQFLPLNLKNALGEAAEGKIGTTIDQIVMFCFQYDPSLQSYVPHAINIMKLGGVLTMVLLGGLLGILWYREKSNNQNDQA